MKTSFGHLLVVLGLTAACQAGEFVNLDLNSPDLSHSQYDPWTRDTLVPPQDALRGWSMQWDWSGPSLALPSFVGTIGGWAPFGLSPGLDTYFGAYRLQVEEYWYPPNAGSLRPTFHLYQAGLVPTGATALNYWISNPAYPFLADRAMQVYLNDVQQAVSGDFGYHNLDVSGFAGREVKLEFVFPGGPLHFYSFDINGFVPEPSTWALFGLGAVALWFVRRRR